MKNDFSLFAVLKNIISLLCCWFYSRLFHAKCTFGWKNSSLLEFCFELRKWIFQLPVSQKEEKTEGKTLQNSQLFWDAGNLWKSLSTLAPNSDSIRVNIPTTSRESGLLCMWQQHEKNFIIESKQQTGICFGKRGKFLDVGLSLNLSFIKCGSTLCVSGKGKKYSKDCVVELTQNSFLRRAEVTIE
jgi:hypothetical protein